MSTIREEFENFIDELTKFNEGTTLSEAIEEAKQTENAQVERIQQLNERAIGIFSYLLGGTSIFAGLSALLALFGFSGTGLINITFFKHLIESIYFGTGMMFFSTSILFAFLTIAPHRLQRHIDDQDLNKMLTDRMINQAKWKYNILKRLQKNIKHNSGIIKWQTYLIYSSILTLVYSVLLIAISVLGAIERLEAPEPTQTGAIAAETASSTTQTATNSYYIPEGTAPVYLVDGWVLFGIFLVIMFLMYFPLSVRFRSREAGNRLNQSPSNGPVSENLEAIVKLLESKFILLPYFIITIESFVFLYLSLSLDGPLAYKKEYLLVPLLIGGLFGITVSRITDRLIKKLESSQA